jgi:serine/threonine protein kinase
MEARSSDARYTSMVLPPGVVPLELEDPSWIGEYRLLGRLGVGGMGTVYLGTDRRGALAAVKSAHTATTDAAEVRGRFRAEAAGLRRVPASCTARLLADGTDHVPPYIVTEYVEGRSLDDIVEREGPLPPEQLRALATGVARALAAIHWTRLIHRDLKPANVLLTATGPRVIDFGIAQDIPATGGITRTGVVVGSPGWIAPERLARCPATPAADVFGWGCLIAYAGTGRNPFGAGDADQVAQRVLYEPPDLAGLDGSLRGPVAAALAKEPADRPAAGELLPMLDAGPSSTRLMPVVERRWRPGGRTVAALAMVAALGGLGSLAGLIALDSESTSGGVPHGGAITSAPRGRTGRSSQIGSYDAPAPSERARPGAGHAPATASPRSKPPFVQPPEFPVSARGPGRPGMPGMPERFQQRGSDHRDRWP